MVGEECLARWSVDNKLYEAKIKRFNKTSSATLALVSYRDYGSDHDEWVDVKRIQKKSHVQECYTQEDNVISKMTFIYHLIYILLQLSLSDYLNSIFSIPLNSIWSIPHQIYQFQIEQFQVSSIYFYMLYKHKRRYFLFKLFFYSVIYMIIYITYIHTFSVNLLQVPTWNTYSQ